MTNKIIIVFLSTFLTFVLGSLLTYYYVTDHLVVNCPKVNASNTTAAATTLTKDNIYLLADKLKKIDRAATKQVFFAVKKTPIGEGIYRVEISISGDDKTLVDAADLQLIIPANVAVSDIKTGNAFLNYPRSLLSDDRLIVTGVATPEKDQVKFGQVNADFVSFKLTVQNRQLSVPPLTIDREHSDIFLMGQSVMNRDLSFSQLNFD